MDDRAKPTATRSHPVLQWLESDDARRYAISLVNRYRLSCEGSDLVQQAWVRAATRFSVLGRSVHTFESAEEGVRYGYRILSNLAIDALRAQGRHALARADTPSSHSGAEENVISALAMEVLLRRIATIPVSKGNCGGCSPDVIRAIALMAVQHVAVSATSQGFSPDAEWFETVIEEATARIQPPASASLARKRKSRCTQCVRTILESALKELDHDA